jgi:hypothetical protein
MEEVRRIKRWGVASVARRASLASAEQVGHGIGIDRDLRLALRFFRRG